MHWTEIAERRAGGAIVLEVRGYLTLSDQEASLYRHVTRLVESGARTLVLNLRHVSYVDSVGIGEIVRTYMLVTSCGGRLALCEVGPRVRDVIETTQLDSVLTMFDSEAQALE